MLSADKQHDKALVLTKHLCHRASLGRAEGVTRKDANGNRFDKKRWADGDLPSRLGFLFSLLRASSVCNIAAARHTTVIPVLMLVRTKTLICT